MSVKKLKVLKFQRFRAGMIFAICIFCMEKKLVMLQEVKESTQPSNIVNRKQKIQNRRNYQIEYRNEIYAHLHRQIWFEQRPNYYEIWRNNNPEYFKKRYEQKKSLNPDYSRKCSRRFRETHPNYYEKYRARHRKKLRIYWRIYKRKKRKETIKNSSKDV